MVTSDSDPARPVTSGGLRNRDRTVVLHVDDDEEFAELVAIYVEREGEALEVETVDSAAAALKRLAEEPIDCVVSDYDMPGTDGLELLEAVRERRPDLPFILYTGRGDETVASEAISAGVTDYLRKNGRTDQYALLANRIEQAVSRYRAERESKDGFRAIETAREGIAFLDEEGSFLFVNDAYADVFGYEPDALEGEHWETLYPDAHVQEVYEEILPSIPKTGQWSGESVHVRADGQHLVVDQILSYTETGTLLCLIRDVTEQKATEKSLHRERQRFEQFVDAVEEYAIFTLDAEGFVTGWNSGGTRLLGYPDDDILGVHVSTFYPEPKAEAGVPDELLDTARPADSVDDTGWLVDADGSRLWTDVTITAVEDDGTHNGFLVVVEDVADRRPLTPPTADPSLEQALDVLEDLFYVLDEEGSIVRISEQAVETTGYSREELLSMETTELFEPDDRARVLEDIEKAFETGSATIQADLVTRDGRSIPHEFRKRRLTDADGIVYLAGIGRDVTERERRERQLQRQLEQFEHFGNVLSHDLRTPLQTAQGRLELSRETGEVAHLDDAEAALERLEESIDDLAATMREGELVDDLDAVALGAAVHSVWNALPTDDATLRIDHDCTIEADGDALKRLLENLVSNALEHVGDEVTVTVGRFEDGFYVADDGCGIPEDERERVFEAGYTTSEDGSGFGLASVRQLVVAHGWTVRVTESDTGGARFEFTDVTVLE